jgi:hypothetical protein
MSTRWKSTVSALDSTIGTTGNHITVCTNSKLVTPQQLRISSGDSMVS